MIFVLNLHRVENFHEFSSLCLLFSTYSRALDAVFRAYQLHFVLRTIFEYLLTLPPSVYTLSCAHRLPFPPFLLPRPLLTPAPLALYDF